MTALTARRQRRARREPTATRSTPAAARGLGFALLLDAGGDDACVGCGLCAAVCPPAVITVRAGAVLTSPHTGRERGRVEDFVLDARGCTACELCMQVCPTDALRLFADPAVDQPRRLGITELRANATRVRRGPRRSPLGPAPGSRRAARPPRRTGRGAVTVGGRRSATPTPAVDLGVPGAIPRPSRPESSAHPVESTTAEPTRMESFAHPAEAPTEQDDDSVAASFDGRPPHSRPDPDEQPTRRSDLQGIDLSDQLDSGLWLESDDELIEFTSAQSRARRRHDRAPLGVAPGPDDPDEPDDDAPTENAADDPTENIDPGDPPDRDRQPPHTGRDT